MMKNKNGNTLADTGTNTMEKENECRVGQCQEMRA